MCTFRDRTSMECIPLTSFLYQNRTHRTTAPFSITHILTLPSACTGGE